MKTTKYGGMIPVQDIVIKDSGKPDSITTIMVGVHGNELAGPQTLDELIDDIKVISGKVYFIFANLAALKIYKRYFEKDMNRCFLEGQNGDSYEEQRVQQILPYLDESDYLLDCHNTTSTINSIPMLLGEQPEWAEYFDIDIMVTGFNNIQPGASDGYMANKGKVGICLESGNLSDINGPIRAKKAIYNFLKATKNIAGQPEIFKDTKQYNFDLNYITQTDNFVLSKAFGDFEKIKKGELIGMDGNKKILATYDGVLLFTHNRYSIGEEAFCMGKLLG